jgi:hypothetical protein
LHDKYEAMYSRASVEQRRWIFYDKRTYFFAIIFKKLLIVSDYWNKNKFIVKLVKIFIILLQWEITYAVLNKYQVYSTIQRNSYIQ